MEVTIAENNPDLQLSTQQTFCFIPNVLARGSSVPIAAMSVASDRGPE